MQLGFSDGLGVVLDCLVCKRTRRMVILGEDERESQCTPTGHRFPGRVVRHETLRKPSPWPCGMSRMEHEYRIEYDYESFSDSKNGRAATPEPRWARIGLVNDVQAAPPTARSRPSPSSGSDADSRMPGGRPHSGSSSARGRARSARLRSTVSTSATTSRTSTTSGRRYPARSRPHARASSITQSCSTPSPSGSRHVTPSRWSLSSA